MTNIENNDGLSVGAVMSAIEAEIIIQNSKHTKTTQILKNTA
jgi:hypothetical protein